jgi:enoyl-CoA hydratase
VGITSEMTGAGVFRITMDKPEKLNAVDTPMLEELAARLVDASDESVRVVVLSGAGRAFCAGGDLSGRSDPNAVVAACTVVRAIASLPKPVVAGVGGAAAGFGCSLALACDLVVAARSAFFQLAFARIGLMPDGGASALVPASVGRARAARMAMLAERIEAATAFEWGMISHLVDDDAYADELEAIVQTLATGPTLSYGWIKRALAESTLPRLSEAQTLETEGMQTLKETSDFREGVRAFLKRRKPEFLGR